MKHAVLGLALAGGLGLAACQKNDLGFSKGDVDLALRTLKAAPQQGFAPGQFDEAGIERLLASDKAQGIQALRAALVAYARAEHGLTLRKSAFPPDWGLKPADYDAESTLAQALRDGTFKDWLDSQPPPLPAYQALQQAYVAYLKIQASGGWPLISAEGLEGPQAEVLRQRLAFEDPQAATAPADATAVDLPAALQRFQAAHGLATTGQLDPPTLQALNVPAIARLAQIRANLERLRWLPRQEPATRIDVNTAAATMSYFEDGKLVTHMLAASGRPGGDETPMLASAVDGIVLNPPWNVPDAIAQEEILPKGAAYLQEKGFEMKDGRLVQKAGPQAALGLVKFEFPNPYAVYLHDTPAKAAFSQTQRAVSHGCVRLAQAVDFAKLLLSKEKGWPPARIDETLASGGTVHIKLAHKTAVRLIYLTAFPEGDHIAFRPDIYRWDVALLQLLDHPPKAVAQGKKA